jgi:hypothetical protein
MPCKQKTLRFDSKATSIFSTSASSETKKLRGCPMPHINLKLANTGYATPVDATNTQTLKDNC